ncbi:MAG: ankyrin repeat domain-containing protein [Acidobacteria bacterium]|nr:ankyrin repeat domain-containing protein [Acidobacteriota bacterium]
MTMDTNQTQSLHDAYVRGDVEAIRRLMDDPPDFPNTRGPMGIGEIVLEYAIYWSPFLAIKQLLEMSANPNYGAVNSGGGGAADGIDHAGFPSLIAALSTKRDDKLAIVELLLALGADIQQRGHNDWTPLHWAAATNEPAAVELLLKHGADPHARTRIDNLETPLDEAERAGHAEVVKLLRGVA